MSINIQYLKQFSKEYKDFIIVLSKLSELKNIKNLPFDVNIFIKNKELEKILQDNHYYESFVRSNKYKYFHNIKLILLNSLKNDQFILEGAKLFSKFNKKTNKELNFIFTSRLIKNYNNLCSNFIFGMMLKSYSFSKYKKNKHSFFVKSINIFNSINFKLKNFNKLNNLLISINYTKDLISEPANILNPVSYAERCLELKKIGLKVKVLNLQQIEKIGMHSLLGVSHGSVNEPRVVIFEWNLKNTKKPTILVGKGVTFDTGGISLKPSGGMEEMITDMGGSAVVVGSMMNAALNKLNNPLVGIIGLVENMPDGKAQRPGDIVKSLSGQTIEVLNTDAEGRLVLADILTYVQKKYQPKEIIDFATLTGAIMVALGTYKAGLFSNNNNLANRIFKSGEITNENVWRLPLGEEYDKDINSSRADMQNIGVRYGGSITAAQFIQRFIENNTPWAHIDIAGVTWTKKTGLKGNTALHSSGATAFGVRLMYQFLTDK